MFTKNIKLLLLLLSICSAFFNAALANDDDDVEMKDVTTPEGCGINTENILRGPNRVSRSRRSAPRQLFADTADLNSATSGSDSEDQYPDLQNLPARSPEVNIRNLLRPNFGPQEPSSIHVEFGLWQGVFFQSQREAVINWVGGFVRNNRFVVLNIGDNWFLVAHSHFNG